ncbi:hypothetical protein EAH87_02195 [Sphingomonas koreensis]|nr:hypothetical protein EAH87_02195 [Sphingomonas koreensis]
MSQEFRNIAAREKKSSLPRKREPSACGRSRPSGARWVPAFAGMTIAGFWTLAQANPRATSSRPPRPARRPGRSSRRRWRRRGGRR